MQFASIIKLVNSVSKYKQQMISADDIFSDSFFVSALRVNGLLTFTERPIIPSFSYVQFRSNLH